MTPDLPADVWVLHITGLDCAWKISPVLRSAVESRATKLRVDARMHDDPMLSSWNKRGYAPHAPPKFPKAGRFPNLVDVILENCPAHLLGPEEVASIVGLYPKRLGISIYLWQNQFDNDVDIGALSGLSGLSDRLSHLSLRVVSISYPPLDIAPLTALTALTELSIDVGGMNVGPTDFDLQPIAALTGLRSLHLSVRTASSPLSLSPVSALTNLDRLSLRVVRWRMEGLAMGTIETLSPLSTLQGLRHLVIRHSRFAHDGSSPSEPLETLRKLTRLENIDFARSDIYVEVPLLAQLPSLRHLALDRGHVDSIRATLTALETLCIGGTDASDAYPTVYRRRPPPQEFSILQK